MPFTDEEIAAALQWPGVVWTKQDIGLVKGRLDALDEIMARHQGLFFNPKGLRVYWFETALIETKTHFPGGDYTEWFVLFKLGDRIFKSGIKAWSADCWNAMIDLVGYFG